MQTPEHEPGTRPDVASMHGGTGDRVLVVACLNGALHGRSLSRCVPFTPSELEAEGRRAAEAGASMLTFVPRDDDGHPTRDPGRIRETVDAVMSCSPLPCAVSLLDYDGDAASRRLLVAGRPTFVEVPVGAPRLARFDPAVSAFGPDRVLALPRSELASLSLDAQEHGVWPLPLASDPTDLVTVAELERLGYIAPELPVAIELLADHHLTLPLLMTTLARTPLWAVGVRGKGAWRAHAMALSLGGGVRVGFEYGARLPNGDDARSNASLVEAAVRLVHAAGLDVLDSGELRRRVTRATPAN